MESRGWRPSRDLTCIACPPPSDILKGQFTLINSYYNIQEQGIHFGDGVIKIKWEGEMSLRAPFEENIHFGKNTLIKVADTGGTQPKYVLDPSSCFFMPFCAISMYTCLSGSTGVPFLCWMDLSQQKAP